MGAKGALLLGFCQGRMERDDLRRSLQHRGLGCGSRARSGTQNESPGRGCRFLKKKKGADRIRTNRARHLLMLKFSWKEMNARVWKIIWVSGDSSCSAAGECVGWRAGP